MPKVLEITPSGARAASLAENRDRLNEDQREAFGADLSLSPQTPQSMWSGIAAGGLTEVGEGGVRAALFGSSVDHAEGVYLDALGSNLDVRRRNAIDSRVTATLTGVAGTAVPTDSRAKTTAGDEFLTLDDVILSPSGVTVEMEAVEDGPIEAPIGTLTEIVSVIPGWETITNTSAATVGRSRQPDEDYRATYLVRTAHSSIGPMSALEAALEEALGGKTQVEDNSMSTPVVKQDWSLLPHSLIVFAQTGTDADLQRAITNHRGMGVATNVGIVGGAHSDLSALQAITAGVVNWDGTDYTPLDLSGAADLAACATALTSLLNPTSNPSGVTVGYSLDRFISQFAWQPGLTPNFGTGTAAAALGLDSANNVYPPGNFMRPRIRDLTVGMTLTRRGPFPSDGLSQVRAAVLAQVEAYQIGDEIWLNDLLCEAERVRGTRITLMTVEAGGVAVSGIPVPLDNLWRLPASNLTVMVV